MGPKPDYRLPKIPVVDATGEIFGDVPNVAARAQALAEPGLVVITARVQHQGVAGTVRR